MTRLSAPPSMLGLSVPLNQTVTLVSGILSALAQMKRRQLPEASKSPIFTIMLDTSGALGTAKAVASWLHDKKVKDEDKAPWNNA